MQKRAGLQIQHTNLLKHSTFLVPVYPIYDVTAGQNGVFFLHVIYLSLLWLPFHIHHVQ